MANFKKIICGVLLVLWTIVSVSVAAAEELPVIRMVVADKAPACTVGIAGPYSIAGEKGEEIQKGNYLETMRVSCSGGQIQWGDRQFSEKKILLQAQEGDIRVGGVSFAPRMEILASGTDRVTAVSLMELEEYTRGVLQKEMEPAWPLEVLKAQAVLVRTNAVYAYLKNKDKSFHLTRTAPQVYAHLSQSQPNTVTAAEETRGLVFMFDGKVIPAYFHSVCGGGTEAAANVWQQPQSTPGTVACNYCRNAPKYSWKSKMSVEQFKDKLSAAGISIPDVKDVFAAKVSTVSDRITEVVVEHSRGKTILRTNTLRGILGNDNIRSTNFSIARQGDDLVFQGQGWGHGVGLCQWGARELAKQGKNFEEILKFYYPGVRIVRVKE